MESYDEANPKWIHKFRAWQLEACMNDPNVVERFINRLANSDFTFSISIECGWVYVTAVKQCVEFIKHETELGPGPKKVK